MAATEEQTDRSPLFMRLPPGPHSLEPDAVRRNQRVRLCGAMAAAVADEGYETTTVTRIAGLAGVSRRAFYEQFIDKDALLDAVVEELGAELARRMLPGPEDAELSVDERLNGAFERAAVLLGSRQAWLSLMIEASRATPSSRQRCQRLLCDVAQIVASILGESPAGVLPPLLLRGVVSGAAEALISSLHEHGESDAVAVREQIGRWVIGVQTQLPPVLATQTLAFDSRTRAALGALSRRRLDGQNVRILLGALRAAAAREAQATGAPAIAEHAQVAPEEVLALHADACSCLAAAGELLRSEILELLGAIAARGPGDCQTLRVTLALLVGYLSADRDRVRALDGDDATTRRAFRRAVGHALTQAAGLDSLTDPVGEALCAAIWSVSLAPSCRTKDARLLVVEQLVYLVLASALGAERAIAHSHQSPPTTVAS